MSKRVNVHFSSASDDWATPQEVVDRYGKFDLDPCADACNAKAPTFFTKQDDGLTKPWFGRVWMNPPYGRGIKDWISKAANSECEVVALLPARTDTRWFHDHIYGKADVEFLKGRIKFGGHKNAAPFPSMVVIFNKKESK
jgi:site-specific DNA-methyltransferase (adenine-specific)